MRIRLLSALCLTVFAASPLFAAPKAVTLSTASATFASYVAGPETATQCVVLVHDWFGVSSSYKDAVDRLAQQGYCVVAVDLYNGRTATTHDEASALLNALDSKVAGEKIDAAIKSLGDRPRQIAVMGFSMGARHALAAAARNASVRATVLWYGGTTKDADRLRALSRARVARRRIKGRVGTRGFIGLCRGWRERRDLHLSGCGTCFRSAT